MLNHGILSYEHTAVFCAVCLGHLVLINWPSPIPGSYSPCYLGQAKLVGFAGFEKSLSPPQAQTPTCFRQAMSYSKVLVADHKLTAWKLLLHSAPQGRLYAYICLYSGVLSVPHPERPQQRSISPAERQKPLEATGLRCRAVTAASKMRHGPWAQVQVKHKLHTFLEHRRLGIFCLQILPGNETLLPSCLRTITGFPGRGANNLVDSAEALAPNHSSLWLSEE